MERSLSSAVVLAGVLMAGAWPHRVAAQNSASVPHSPDLLGIYTGMPADQANAQLQKHSSDAYVQYASNASEGFGMSVPGEPTDLISVSITQAPNVPTVWRVERYQGFSNQKPLPRNALLDALHQKYGKETLSRSPDAGHMELYWIFDSNGQLRSKADSGLMACSAPPPSSVKGAIYPQCAKDFFAVYVSMVSGGTDGGDVQSYTLVLVNYPYEVQGGKASDAKQAEGAQDQPRKPTAAAPTF